jgi:hypothetical protein
MNSGCFPTRICARRLNHPIPQSDGSFSLSVLGSCSRERATKLPRCRTPGNSRSRSNQRCALLYEHNKIRETASIEDRSFSAALRKGIDSLCPGGPFRFEALAPQSSDLCVHFGVNGPLSWTRNCELTLWGARPWDDIPNGPSNSVFSGSDTACIIAPLSP